MSQLLALFFDIPPGPSPTPNYTDPTSADSILTNPTVFIILGVAVVAIIIVIVLLIVRRRKK
jgi:LPXTG-motif cell wall-anchored protein